MNLRSSTMLFCAFCALQLGASDLAWNFGERGLWRSTGAVIEKHAANSTEYLSSETEELSIWSPELDLDADEFQSLEVFYHLEGVATILSLSFETADHPGDLAGRVITLDLPVNILRTPRKVVFDLAANPNWKGRVRKLRLMLNRRWGGELFQLHAVTLRGAKDTLSDGANATGQFWTIHDKTGQFCTKITHIRQDFRYRLGVDFAPEGLAPSAKACFWDDDDHPCAEIPLKRVADGRLAAEYIARPEWFRGEVQVFFTGTDADQRGHLISASLEALGPRLQWQGEWIWPVKPAQMEQTACFLKDFDLDCEPKELSQALLQATCDDAFTLFLNGAEVTRHDNWAEPRVLDVREFLQKGRNRIFVKALNHTAAGAFLAELRLDYRDSRPATCIATSTEWLCTLEAVPDAESPDCQPNPAQWSRPVSLGCPPTPPWNALALQERIPQPPQLTPPDHVKIAAETMTAKLNHDLDYPRIELNGQVVPPIFFGTRWLGDRTESIADSVAGGFQLYRMFWELSSHWRHDGTVDFATLDQDVEELLSANPDAHAILAFRLTAPAWWMQEHPEELCKYLDGKTDGHYGPLPSTASERWLAEAAECTRQLVEHVEHSWYASRIIGYMPCALSGPEWVLTHKFASPPDYSDCMRSYFRNFLREKYHGDERLQFAWNRPAITFDTVEIPRENERYPEGRSVLTPELDQCAIDFNRAINRSVGDAILRMMRVVRAGAPRKLTMVYYGYVLNLPELYTYSPSLGHNDLERLISSGLIDIFASPITYTRRRLGDYSGTVSLAESFRRHGVLWLQEADCRTNLTEEKFGHKYTHNLQDSLAELRREFAFAMIRRLGIWFYDMNGGWYHNPLYYKEFQQMHERYSQTMQEPTTFHSPVAVVFDPENCDYLPVEIGNYTVNHTRLQLFNFQDGLTRAGVPFDQIGMDDFLHGDLSHYRLLVFPNLFHLPEGFEERLDQSHCNVLFLGTPGLADGIEASRRLTGLPLVLRAPDSPISYYLKGAPEKRGGVPGLHSPKSFTADVEESAVLAQYPDGSAAAAVAPRADGTFRAWAAASENSGLLYRMLLQRAGIETLVDRADRVEFDGRNLLLMTMDGSGLRHLNLPGTEEHAVRDAATRTLLAPDARDFTLELSDAEIQTAILE